MNAVKVLVSDPRGSAPRSGPTIETMIDYNNIAFAQLFQWVSTDHSGHRFDHITRDMISVPGIVKVLVVWLVRPEDGAGVSKRFSPYNVLFVTEEIDQFLQFTQIQSALGQNWYKTTVHREILVPPGFNTAGLMLDGKRVKISRGTGDAWVNLRTVTDVTEPKDGEQALVMKNYHPSPVPTLEYRIFVDPLSQEAQARASAFSKGIQPVACQVYVPDNVPVGVDTPLIKIGDDGKPIYDDEQTVDLKLDGLDVIYMAYMYQSKDGKSRRANLGRPLPEGAIPYMLVSTFGLIETKTRSGKDRSLNFFLIPLEDSNELRNSIIKLVYPHDAWHTYAEETVSDSVDEDGDPVYLTGDIWVSRSAIDGITPDTKYPTPAQGHLADWMIPFSDHRGNSFNVYIADQDPLVKNLMIFRWFLEGQRKSS